MPGTHRIARRTLASLVAVAALAVPAQAGAATTAAISLSGTTLNVNSDGAASNITITVSGSNFLIADSTGPVTGSGFCGQTTDTPAKVTCPSAGLTHLGSTLGGGHDTLNASAVPLIANVNGNGGNDRITTGPTNDVLIGDTEDDWLDGGLGTDVLEGGTGGDLVMYPSRTAPVAINFGTNQQTTQSANSGQSGENDKLSQFEYALGGSGNDTLTGDGWDNFLAGGLGNDTINGAGGNDYAGYWERSESVTVTLAQGAMPGTGGKSSGGETDWITSEVESAVGGSGDDLLVGNDSNNTLWGGWSAGSGSDGDDVLRGKGGADVIWGDQGSDTADYSDKTGQVTADADGVRGGTGDDGVSGEMDNILTDVENITGGSGNDTLNGTAGPNVLIGNAGTDTLNGAAGADTLRGGLGGDTLTGGTGSDSADYSDKTVAVAASLDGLSNDHDGDSLGSDIENLIGGSAGDTLTGDAGANVLSGGVGADTLTGGAGADSLDGGSGPDVFAARDGAVDAVDCGEGGDSGEIDSNDVLSTSCESTVRPPVTVPPPDPDPDTPVPPTPPVDPPLPPGDTGSDDPKKGEDKKGDDKKDDGQSGEENPQPKGAAPVEIKTPAAVALNARGELPVPIRCTAPSGECTGKIELWSEDGVIKARAGSDDDVTASRRRKASKKGRAVLLARRGFRVRAGHRKTVPLVLNRNGRRRIIKTRGRKRHKIVVTMKAPDGATLTTVKSVSIKAPKERRQGRRPTGRRKDASR